MGERIKIVGMSGSLRQGSYNSALLRLAWKVIPEGAELQLVRLDDLPLYNGDVEDAGMPTSQTSNHRWSFPLLGHIGCRSLRQGIPGHTARGRCDADFDP